MQPTQSSFLKWALIAGIVIVLNMFFNYALSLIYTEPVFDTYMSRPQVVQTLYTKESCLSIGGQWSESVVTDEIKDPQGKLGGYCDPDYTKRMQYDADRKEYNRNIFLILTALGALSLGLGVALKQRFEVVAIAFSWGGVLSFLIASMRYWSDANNLFKVLILAVALGALITLGVKKFAKL